MIRHSRCECRGVESHEGISAKAKGDGAAVSWLPLVPLVHRPGSGRETHYIKKYQRRKTRVAQSAPLLAYCCNALAWRVDHVSHLLSREFCAERMAVSPPIRQRLQNAQDSLPADVFCCQDGPVELSAHWKLRLSSFEASRRSVTWLVETSAKGEER